MPDPQQTLHATSVAIDGKAVLIGGESGSGKSDLALGLMALGAELISDDRTRVTTTDTGLIAAAPGPIAGLIEARGIGILRAVPSEPCPVVLYIDLSSTETERLPPARSVTILGQDLPLLHKAALSHFPAAILQYVRAGRVEDDA